MHYFSKVWAQSLLLTKAAFIWSKLVKTVILCIII